MEGLEPRLMLSGNVLAEVSGGVLMLTGDLQDNQIRVEQDVGFAADQFRVTPLGMTVINGVYAPLELFGVTRGVRALMGDGADAVEVLNAALPGQVLIDGQDGQLDVTMGSTLATGRVRIVNRSGDCAAALTGLFADSHLQLDTGGGTQTLTLTASRIAGQVRSLCRDADSHVTLETGSRIERNLALFSRNGTYHTLRVDNSRVDGNVIVRNTDGDTTVSLVNISAIGGGLSMANGGPDYNYHGVTLAQSSVAGNARIANSAGNSALNVTNSSSIGRALSVRNGDGEDEILIRQSQVGGHVAVSNGRGTSSVTVEQASDVGGNLSARGLSDHHSVFVVGSHVGGNAAVRGLGGIDAFFTDATTVDGNLTVSGQSGTFHVEQATVGGRVALRYAMGGTANVFTNSLIVGNLIVRMVPGGSFNCFDSTVLGSVLANSSGSVWLRDSAVGRDVRVRTGAGNDTCWVYGTTVGRATSIRAGHGTNEVSIQDGDFSGPASIVTGGQGDSIALDTDATAAGVATFFRDRLTVRTGSGNDVVQVGHTLGDDEVRSFGASLFDGGGGDDVVGVWGRGNVFDVAPVIRNFETVS